MPCSEWTGSVKTNYGGTFLDWWELFSKRPLVEDNCLVHYSKLVKLHNSWQPWLTIVLTHFLSAVNKRIFCHFFLMVHNQEHYFWSDRIFCAFFVYPIVPFLKWAAHHASKRYRKPTYIEAFAQGQAILSTHWNGYYPSFFFFMMSHVLWILVEFVLIEKAQFLGWIYLGKKKMKNKVEYAGISATECKQW